MNSDEKIKRLLKACGIFEETNYRLQKLSDRIDKAIKEANSSETIGVTQADTELFKDLSAINNELQQLYRLKTSKYKKEIESKTLESLRLYFIGLNPDSLDKWIDFFESDAGKELVEIKIILLGILDRFVEAIGEEIFIKCLEETQNKKQTIGTMRIKGLN